MDNRGLVEDAKRRELRPTPVSRVGEASRVAAEKAEGVDDSVNRRAPVSRVAGRETAPAKKQGGFLKKKGASLAIVGILVAAMIVLVPLTPSLLIGTIKENLIKTLGFKDTIAILLKQGKFVTGEMLAKGKVPSEYAGRLAAVGIEAGQLNSIGQFVRTNTYIANIDEAQVAAEGMYYASVGEGELVARFNDEIITASELVAKIDAEPKLYAAYEEAANLSALYYHGSDVAGVLKDMGLSGGSFQSFENTGNYAEDEKNFNEIMEKTLDSNGSRSISGAYILWEEICPDDGPCYWVEHPVSWWCDGSGESFQCVKEIDGDTTSTTQITGTPDEVATALINYVAQNSRHDTERGTSAEQNAAQNLNALLSSEEPYRAATAFMTTMEAIERAQVSGDGPVNEMMNALTRPSEVTYTDVKTGETKTERKSVVDTQNFYAAVADGSFSRDEANNFSRDNVLMVTGLKSDTAIKETGLSIDGKKRAGDGLKMVNRSGGDHDANGDNSPASTAELSKAMNGLKISLAEKNSELFSSIVGGNRILEGGSLVMNTENQQLIGALPSTAEKVALYKKEVDTEIARMAEAERAVKSPFDISSPNTFMGALVRKAAVATLGLQRTNGGSLVGGLIGFIGGLTKGGASGVFATVLADDGSEKFVTMIGDGDTVPTTGAVNDLYGTAHTTPYTGKMELDEEGWKAVLGSDTFDSNGEINESSKLSLQVVTANDRDATVGVRSYEVCKNYNDAYDKAENGIMKFVRQIISVVTRALAIVDECDRADDRYGSDALSTGRAAVLGTEETETALNSGYLLYDRVKSLLSGTESKATALRRKIYSDTEIARE